MTVDGQDYAPGSAFEILPTDAAIAFSAQEDAEFVCMVLHEF